MPRRTVRWLALATLGFACTSSPGLAAVTTSGSTLNSSGTFYVGYTADGTLGIGAGSLLSDTYGDLGYNSGCAGTVTVTGTGSTWTNTSDLTVGDSGRGTLNVETGGQVTNDCGYVANESGSTGTVTVTGTGSTWTNNYSLVVGESGGTGTLYIQAGGQVSNSSGYLDGTGTVTGTGSRWANSSALTVGSSGSGTLNIQAGGHVSSYSGFLGYGDGTGTVTVTGTGSTWTNNSGLTIGENGNGTLNVEAGGEVSSSTAMLGVGSASSGVAKVTGTGSAWTSGNIEVGFSGSGKLNIQAGAQVSSGTITLGHNPGSTGTATVTGTGSRWTSVSDLFVGYWGGGTLNVQAGGHVSSYSGFLGSASGSIGMATVTGPGSVWTNTSSLYVGRSGNGTLTIADGGAVIAKSVTVNNNASAVRLDVSGNNMLVTGNATTVGSVTNNGAINFYADAFLPAGTYTPIAEFAGRTMTWSGTGTYNAVGGTWNSAAKTLAVTAATPISAGAVAPVSSGQRLLIADPVSCQQVGASFDGVAGGTTFSAALMTLGELSSLAALPGFQGSVLSGWDFTTNLSGSQVLLSYDIGLGKEDLELWHLSGGTWSPYTPDLLTYDANGILTFTASQFSGYAVTGVPEPSTFALLGVGTLSLLGYAWRRRKRAA